MTLVEVLVTAALLLIALAVTAVLFRYGARTTKASQERSDALAGRTLLSERLRKAFSNSFRSGNTYFYLTESEPDPDLAICLLTNEAPDGEKGWNPETNRPIYQGYRIFYRNGDDNTIRYLFHPISPTEEAKALSESQVERAIGGGTSRVLLKDATGFCLYSLKDGRVSTEQANPLGLRWRTGLERGNSIVTEKSFKLINL